ncbi:MAG: EscU/YscU/HrcU family type III secretion system export apparatus switch protein [Clostridiales bacterium]|jgi:flagellar biosynthesis protein|nr:EscU/YscU/HrcU family type III secretion system export apparatus switch protein [Clostridiales bacterium]
MDEKAKRQKAVAIKYNPSETAPKVVAKGHGVIAEKIISKAQQSDVPVHEDAALVEELERVELGANIPPELYEIVAQILVFISDLDKLESYKKTGGNGAFKQ